MYVQPDRTPAPATPILEETCGRSNPESTQWNLWSVVYHSLLNAIAIVAAVSIILVNTGVLNVGDKAAQFKWADNPGYIYRVITLQRVLKDKTDFGVRIQAVRYLSKKFPLVFVDTTPALAKSTLDPLKSQRSCVSSTASKNKLVVCIGDFVFHRNDAKRLRTTFIILNLSCLFQYVMTGFMWGYSAISRPGFVLPALLPPTILCSVIGEYRINRLSKKVKERQAVVDHGVPILGELSSRRGGMSPA